MPPLPWSRAMGAECVAAQWLGSDQAAARPRSTAQTEAAHSRHNRQAAGPTGRTSELELHPLDSRARLYGTGHDSGILERCNKRTIVVEKCISLYIAQNCLTFRRIAGSIFIFERLCEREPKSSFKNLHERTLYFSSFSDEMCTKVYSCSDSFVISCLARGHPQSRPLPSVPSTLACLFFPAHYLPGQGPRPPAPSTDQP